MKDRLQVVCSSPPPCTVQILLFADDIVVCTEKKEDMERNLAEMQVHGTGEMGNENALGEVKVMMVSRTGEECKISVDGKRLIKWKS